MVMKTGGIRGTGNLPSALSGGTSGKFSASLCRNQKRSSET
ncbi:hypothetical protein NEISICOT_00317 [Neisseria sicca ATCC 29256]|uniref:Uncharacterized protein n=2 Tax=Neisseria sicca TaxID=490 RepID=I2NVY9_NEISI|nr:hypothetical protein NEISICOT_00317 [Neisseria sicca ATCC 29256]EIG30000.1 hypothetical protein HMPREF1051_0162 [Neisseria sicca VK64]